MVNVAFNVFRFGTWSNLTYNAPFTRVPGVPIKVKLALADWLAPNVGVLFFWTVTAVVLAGVLVATVVTIVRRPRQLRSWLPALAVVVVTAVFTGALASWWSTFGWLAWGPRLTLPLLPALVVAAVRAAPDALDAGVQWLFGSAVAGRRGRRGAGGAGRRPGRRGVEPGRHQPPDGARPVVPGAEGAVGDDAGVLLRLRPDGGVAHQPALALGGGTRRAAPAAGGRAAAGGHHRRVGGVVGGRRAAHPRSRFSCTPTRTIRAKIASVRSRRFERAVLFVLLGRFLRRLPPPHLGQ